ncbi:MAG: hypothetical protein ACK4PG_13500 [Acetobacteraceae bacterium]
MSLALALRPGGLAEALASVLRGSLGVPLGLSEPPELLQAPPPPDDPGLLAARLALGGELPSQLLCLGLEAAVAALPATGAVLLADADAASRALFGPSPGPEALLAIRAALVGARPLLAFDRASQRFAAGFGAAAARVPLPPLAPPAGLAPLRPEGVCVFDHGASPALLPAVLEAASRLGPARLLAPGEAFGPARLAAAVHLHLGPGREAPPGCRVADSFACRRPVLVLADPTAAGLADGVEALVAADLPGLDRAIGRLAADPDLAAVLVRGGAAAAAAALARAVSAIAAALSARG